MQRPSHLAPGSASEDQGLGSGIRETTYLMWASLQKPSSPDCTYPQNPLFHIHPRNESQSPRENEWLL